MKSKIKSRSNLIVIITLLLTVAALIWLVNSPFIGNYFQNRIIAAMKQAYEDINLAANNGTLTSEEFDIIFQNTVETYNMNIIVIDTESETLKASSHEYERLSRTLFGYLFQMISADENQIIERNDYYEIRTANEERTGTEYIDMWGLLDNGYLFLIRSPLEAIKRASNIASTLFTYIIIILGIVIIATQTLFRRHRVIVDLQNKNAQLEHDIEKTRELDRMRSEFLSNVSHELKTPIALINGYAEGLVECAEDTETRDYYCDVIMDEASKMSNMVNKLLDINHLEFGDVEYEYSAFDIVEMINNYIQSVNIIIESKNASVRVEPDTPILVYSDEYYIEECFSNYFTNALNHLDGDMKIDIKVTQIGNKARVSVFNTGKTIPEDSMEHLFEKFYKVDKARTREYGGSGVGLSIVKAVLDSLNESYGVENYSNGVLFYFTVECYHNQDL